jgi:hypothetical protein
MGFAVTPAYAQNVILVCAFAPDGPPAIQIDLDFSRSTVNYPAMNTPAQIAERQITWQVPRYEDRGEVRPAMTYRLDRVTGVLAGHPDCMPSDYPRCALGGPTFYCKAAERKF